MHDRSIGLIEKILQKFVNEQGIRVDMTAREKVRRSDFIGRDLVIVMQKLQEGHPKEEDGTLGFFMGSLQLHIVSFRVYKKRNNIL